jgi:succinyl-diaminopimelate desuccinylase
VATTNRGTPEALLTGDELVERLLEHCGHVCVTGDEGPIADAVTDRYRDLGEEVTRVGNSVVVGRPDDGRPLVLLVGHLDVVPPTQDDRDPRRATVDGLDLVVGRGTSDMKAGNVAAMACFEDRALRADSPFEVALVLYGGEEGPAEDNELEDVLAEVPWLREAQLAVILEPTDGEIQAGCLGGLHALLTFRGRQAHSARPWHGENALTKAGAFLDTLHHKPPVEVEVDGLGFRDVWSATQAYTSNTRNTIPGEFMVNLNLRFAPNRDLADAEAELRGFVGERAEVEIVDRAPPAPPALDVPVVRQFVAAVDAPLAGKQAWTDVARFAELGVPAVNYGPGLTAQAHQRGEYVPVDALVEGYRNLHRFLRGA